MKTDELKMAKFLLDKLVREYPTMRNKDGFIKSWGYDTSMKTCKTRAKDDIKLIRRLLLEVANEL
jgi:thymidylate synthase ThyX